MNNAPAMEEYALLLEWYQVNPYQFLFNDNLVIQLEYFIMKYDTQLIHSL